MTDLRLPQIIFCQFGVPLMTTIRFTVSSIRPHGLLPRRQHGIFDKGTDVGFRIYVITELYANYLKKVLFRSECLIRIKQRFNGLARQDGCGMRCFHQADRKIFFFTLCRV